jgi:hypothetical protein
MLINVLVQVSPTYDAPLTIKKKNNYIMLIPKHVGFVGNVCHKRIHNNDSIAFCFDNVTSI